MEKVKNKQGHRGNGFNHLNVSNGYVREGTATQDHTEGKVNTRWYYSFQKYAIGDFSVLDAGEIVGECSQKSRANGGHKHMPSCEEERKIEFPSWQNQLVKDDLHE